MGSALLRLILGEAKGMGLSGLLLETGSFDFFAPARAHYARHGFAECPPFEGYKPDPNSTYMARDI